MWGKDMERFLYLWGSLLPEEALNQKKVKRMKILSSKMLSVAAISHPITCSLTLFQRYRRIMHRPQAALLNSSSERWTGSAVATLPESCDSEGVRTRSAADGCCLSDSESEAGLFLQHGHPSQISRAASSLVWDCPSVFLQAGRKIKLNLIMQIRFYLKTVFFFKNVLSSWLHTFYCLHYSTNLGKYLLILLRLFAWMQFFWSFFSLLWIKLLNFRSVQTTFRPRPNQHLKMFLSSESCLTSCGWCDESSWTKIRRGMPAHPFIPASISFPLFTTFVEACGGN